MSAISPSSCGRCGTPLAAAFRFCPECGLPASGASVLSTQIQELRRRVEGQREGRRRPAWVRLVLNSAATGMLVFVVGLGLVLFNQKLLAKILPEARDATEPLTAVARWEPEWIAIAAGDFPYGDPEEGATGRVAYPYLISKFEVTNQLWLEFLRAEAARLQETGLWYEAFPGADAGWRHDDVTGAITAPATELDGPIRNVSALATVEFCLWLTRRLGEPGVEIRPPTSLEWEYAARGAEGRIYPWGNEFLLPPSSRSGGVYGTLRKGQWTEPVSVRAIQDDTSPAGAVAMGTNVSEWTLMLNLERVGTEPGAPVAEISSPSELPLATLPERLAAQREVNACRRGGSGSDTARIDETGQLVNDGAVITARAWERSVFEPRQQFTYTGVRLVKVRTAAERE